MISALRFFPFMSCSPYQPEVVEAEGTYEPEETTEEETPEETEPSWPMFRHDAAHSAKIDEQNLSEELSIAQTIHFVDARERTGTSAAVIPDLDSLFVSADDEIYRVDLNTHASELFLDTNLMMTLPLAIEVENQKIFLIGRSSEGGNVALIDVKTQQIVWKYLFSNDCFSPPTIKDQAAYFGDNSGYVWAFDLTATSQEEAPLWQKNVETSSIYSSIAADEENFLYFSTRWNGFYCLDGENNGEILWNFPLPAGTSTYSTPSVDENYMYAGINGGDSPEVSEHGRLYCLNKYTGELIWQSEEFVGDVRSSPARGRDKVFVRDALTGKAVAFWKEPTAYLDPEQKTVAPAWEVELSPCKVGDNGVVVVENAEGREIVEVLNGNGTFYQIDAETGDILDEEETSVTFECDKSDCLDFSVAGDKVYIPNGRINGEITVLQ